MYFTIYDGPSQLNGEPIIVIAHVGTANVKTVGMVSTYIMARDVEPNEAANQGLDAAVCGGCALRPLLWKKAKARGEAGPYCYVNKARAPRRAWLAYQEGRAKPATVADLAVFGAVRGGQYGDPAAVPAHVWDGVEERTAYTHQWRSARIDGAYKRIAMASVESPKGAERAHRDGWRTFRVRQWLETGEPEPLMSGEVVCPASKEGGKVATCAECRLCDGRDGKPNVAIIDHGPSSRHQWKRWLEAQGAE